MDHSINLTHDGTLIVRVPKGYKVEKVVVEEMGTDYRKEYQPTHPTPSNTLGALDINGLEEEIRCTMCKNPMRTDRGCDGGCKYDEKLYADIMKVLHGRIKELPSALPTLYGYNIKQLDLIARILQKENLPPERVADALSDMGSIVTMAYDEFTESLRKAVELCTI